MLEASSPKGEVFTYVFVDKSNNKPVILRGIEAGVDRTEFINQLQGVKAHIDAKITGDASGGAVAVQEQRALYTVGPEHPLMALDQILRSFKSWRVCL